MKNKNFLQSEHFSGEEFVGVFHEIVIMSDFWVEISLVID